MTNTPTTIDADVTREFVMAHMSDGKFSHFLTTRERSIVKHCGDASDAGLTRMAIVIRYLLNRKSPRYFHILNRINRKV
jgi:hypothetical protein